MKNSMKRTHPKAVMRGPRMLSAGTALTLAALLVGANLFPGTQTPSASAATTTVTYEDTNSAIVYTGAWGPMHDTRDSKGQVNRVDSTGSAQLTFTGTGINWISRLSPTSGLNDVFIDGAKVATVDRYAAEANTKYAQTVYTKSGLTNGTHSIRLQWTGKKNLLATASNLVVDAFVVTTTTADATPPTTGTPVPVAPTNSIPATSSGAANLGTITVSAKGTNLSWTDASQYPAKYVINRSTNGYDFKPVATVSASSNSYLDISVMPGVLYIYTVSAVDSNNRVSSTSGSRWQYGQGVKTRTQYRSSNCPSSTVYVDSASKLKAALYNAGPGTVIRLASGTYTGQFYINKSGTQTNPIWICGPRTAILTTGSTQSGHALMVDGEHDIVIAGMTLRNSSKGFTVINSSRIVATDLLVENIGEEGVHLKQQTIDSEVKYSIIRRTGLVTAQYGEGIYLGTSDTNWCKYNGCSPDRTNNIVLYKNTISETGAQAIEAKAGTSNGVIDGNNITGRDPGTGGDEWVLVKGNDFLVADNVGHDSPENGFTTNASVIGWGKNNIFTRNSASNTAAYNTWIHQPKELPNLGNRVSCLASSTNVDNGLTNVTCVK